MTRSESGNLKHKGRIGQTWIYFRKFLRMFIYESDWKVLPIGAIIAAIVTIVAGSNMFSTQEGTTYGTFALICACIWNGFFNSIQVVCRERDILKREHRAGLYIFSYVAAHMLYQLLLCLLQTLVILLICLIVGVQIPAQGIITPWGILDIGITILLTTYAADMMALMVSCIVKTTTTAMTVMPFLLIFQLIFSGGFFKLEGPVESLKYATISYWGMNSLCAIGRFNQLPMVTLWNTLIDFKDLTLFGEGDIPLLYILQQVEKRGYRDDFLLWSGSFKTEAAYASTPANVWNCWQAIVLLLIIFAVIAGIALLFVDRDKR